MPKVTPISLDGSTLEGGGQLVRVAFTLSAITGVPVHLFNIRANRMAKGRSSGRSHGEGLGRGGARQSDKGGRDKDVGRGQQRKGRTAGVFGEGGGNSNSTGSSRKPEGGAKESHLAAVLWLAERCDAYLEGAYVGSREITFIPGAGGGGVGGTSGKGKGGRATGNGLVDSEGSVITLERPGSVCLILQCILPYLLFGGSVTSGSAQMGVSPPSAPQVTSKSRQPATAGDAVSGPSPATTTLTLYGGTNVDKAMSTDYIQHVFLPMLGRLSSTDSASTALPQINVEVIKRGWAGSAAQIGEVKLHITSNSSQGPMKLNALNVTNRGDITSISIILLAHGEDVQTMLLDKITSEITTTFGPDIPLEILTQEDSGDIRRLYVLLVAHTSDGYRLGRDVLGTGRLPKNQVDLRRMVGEYTERVVKELAGEVRRGGCVDEFMADQVVVFQALARGRGRLDGYHAGGMTGGKSGKGWREVEGEDQDGEAEEEGEDEEPVGDQGGSLHARTVRWVCEKVLSGKNLGGDGSNGVKFEQGGVCTGVGWNWNE